MFSNARIVSPLTFDLSHLLRFVFVFGLRECLQHRVREPVDLVEQGLTVNDRQFDVQLGTRLVLKGVLAYLVFGFRYSLVEVHRVNVTHCCITWVMWGGETVGVGCPQRKGWGATKKGVAGVGLLVVDSAGRSVESTAGDVCVLCLEVPRSRGHVVGRDVA